MADEFVLGVEPFDCMGASRVGTGLSHKLVDLRTRYASVLLFMRKTKKTGKTV